SHALRTFSVFSAASASWSAAAAFLVSAPEAIPNANADAQVATTREVRASFIDRAPEERPGSQQVGAMSRTQGVPRDLRWKRALMPRAKCCMDQSADFSKPLVPDLFLDLSRLGGLEQEVDDQVLERLPVLIRVLVSEVAHRVEHAAALGRGPFAGALRVGAAGRGLLGGVGA